MSIRILTVCLGNICRSPAAEAVIRAEAARRGLDVEVASAGTAGYHVGEPPHPRSIAAGARRGYQVTGVARRLRPEDFRDFDLIVTMDEANLVNARRIAPPDATARLEPLRRFDPDGDGGLQVPDPWGEADGAYDQMYDLIVPAVRGLLDSLSGPGAQP